MKTESWFILVLVTVCLLSQARATTETCINRTDYVACTGATDYHPPVCNCSQTEKECYIKLTITWDKQNNVFKINDGHNIGPTIITRHKQILAVDVINNSPNETSIHWHGMHQQNMPFMDGVGMVTQWPIPGNGGKFRYILEAHPSGTHWYHSHVRRQRDQGLFGALIVQEKKDLSEKLATKFWQYGTIPSITDEPGTFMLAVTEHLGTSSKSCGVGGTLPDDYEVSLFYLNGKELPESHESNQAPTFDLKPGGLYRFRVIGAMEQTVFRISIEDHILHVIATDGYLVEPYEVDILHVHVGERYDFIVKTHVTSKTVYPIRIDSVDYRCNDEAVPSHTGFASLNYINTGLAPVIDFFKPMTKKALNCPFEKYPDLTCLKDIECVKVTDLQLLEETKQDELPDPGDDVEATYFLNFHFHQVARINDVRFQFPKIPFLLSSDEELEENECMYNVTKASENCDTRCPHTVRIPKKLKGKSVEFVFSSLPRGNEKYSDTKITRLKTHPIHLHGHSFWVKKIVYPQYDHRGSVKTPSEDIDVPDYGYGHWKKSQCPVPVNATTVRKDVIIVPAGGYVVVEFKVHNPGWWFLHCHIDHHLLQGMGIVLGEMPECIEKAPTDKFKELYRRKPTEFCVSVQEFKNQLDKMNSTCATSTNLSTSGASVKNRRRELLENELKVIKSPSNFNQEHNDEPADYKPNQSLYYGAEEQQPRSALREFRKKLASPFDRVSLQEEYNSK